MQIFLQFYLALLPVLVILVLLLLSDSIVQLSHLPSFVSLFGDSFRFPLTLTSTGDGFQGTQIPQLT